MGMNLIQKLVEIRKTVMYLQKNAQGYQFTYNASSQVLGSLRAKMDEMGVLLVPGVTSKEVTPHTNQKGNKEFFTELNMTFTWINAEKPEETLVTPWYAQGLDNAEKGVGKAMTYAEKYFLLKFFNIATDKDDPDSFQAKYEEPVAMINGDQLNAIKKIIADNYLTKEQAKNACITACSKTSTKELTQAEADKLIAALKAIPANPAPTA